MNFIKIGQGDFVKEITTEQLGKEDYILYIHTPFCGTCHMARTILSQIETVHQKDLFYEMNASLHPEFMQEIEIESVPCLLIKKERSEEHTSELQSRGHLVCRLLLEKKRKD